MAMSQKEKIAKQNACLSCIKLCTHNLKGRCKPPKGRECNFAHRLSELQVPEEMYGAWSKAWEKGDVDICFSEDYEPNEASQERFKLQFVWERKHHWDRIPNWAWGRAVHLGLDLFVPAHVPKDFDWPKLQEAWDLSKVRGKSTAESVEEAQRVSERRKRLMNDWQEAKPKTDARKKAHKPKKAKVALPDAPQPKLPMRPRHLLQQALTGPAEPNQLALPSSSAQEAVMPNPVAQSWARYYSSSEDEEEPSMVVLDEEEEEEAPDLPPNMNMAVQAIVGWWHEESGASLMLMGERVTLKLCGYGELFSLKPDVTVQCGAGSWSRKHDFSRLPMHVDLSEWSTFEEHGGKIPDLNAPQDVKTARYKALCDGFQKVWILLLKSKTKTVAFFCKSGRHRSYGLMIGFLMWASLIQDMDMWANLIAEFRDPVLQARSLNPCALATAKDLSQGQVAKGYVPYATILMEFTGYLDSVRPEHAWPFKRP